MSLIQMSIAGGVMIAVVILIRAIAVNRLLKSTFTALWMAVLARLLVPVSVPSVFSVYSLFDNVMAPSPARQPQSVVAAAGSAPEAVQQIQPQIIQTASGNSTFGLTLVWLIGVAVALTAFGAAYAVCFRRLRKAEDASHPAIDQWMNRHGVRKSVAVRLSGEVSSPLTYGLFHPVIILPDNMDLNDSERLDYVLSHELTHIRRFDQLKKLAVILALCLHWFNPLVWVMFVVFNRDIELACDEAVVSGAGHSSRKAYAMALIDMEEKRSFSGTLYSCFNKNAIEERIVAIMKIKSPTVTRMLAAAAIVLAVCLGFATTAYADQEREKEKADAHVISAADIDEFISSVESMIPSEIIAEGVEVSPEEPTGTESECQPEAAPDILPESGSEVAPEAVPEEMPEVPAEKVTETAPEAAPDTTPEPPETSPEVNAGHSWVWPVFGTRITRAFGPSENPLRAASDHITIACGHGDKVVSAISGKVTEAAFTPEHGNYVVICGEDNVRTMYAHLEETSVAVGQTVAAGDKIGTAGATGMVTGACLSFYVFVSDQAVDPMSFYE